MRLLWNSSTSPDVLSKLEEGTFYLVVNGKVANSLTSIVDFDNVEVIPRALGGKGGFGQLLRSFRIFRSRNQDMCRDLSGRRLKDVHEEAKLRAWIDKRAEREKEKERKRKEKIEKLKHVPKHDFNDPEFAQRSDDILEKTEDAVEAGLSAAFGQSSSTSCAAEQSTTSSDSETTTSDDDENITATHVALGKHKMTTMSSTSSSGIVPKSVLPHTEVVKPKRRKYNPNSKWLTDKLLHSSDDEEEILEAKKKWFEKTIKPAAGDAPKSAQSTTDDAQKSVKPADGDVINSVKPADGDAATTIQSTADKQEPPTTAKKSKPIAEKSDATPQIQYPKIDLTTIESVDELMKFPMEHLKSECQSRGLKCGGSLQERAQRLWTIKDLKPKKYPKNLLAK